MTGLKMHRLTHESPEVTERLAQVLALSNVIFCPDPDTKYASMSFWQDRLADDSSLILYLTGDTKHELVDGDPVAFLFAHPRTHSPPLKDGTATSLHIWLAGVLPKWRKAGCLRMMMDELSTSVAGRSLTICTMPSTFPDMWTWLLKRGWSVEKHLSAAKVLLSRDS